MNVVDSETLIKAQREVNVPFVVQGKLEDGRVVEIEFVKLFRLLPGKRIVGLANCEGQRLLVKLFLGRHAKRYANKERSGLEHITLANVRSPKFKWQASFVSGHGEALAMEYLEGAASLQDRWNEAAEDDERVDVLTRAMILIAKLHNQGVVQTDIHLANFLMSEGRIDRKSVV